jgi:hypothetical protein
MYSLLGTEGAYYAITGAEAILPTQHMLSHLARSSLQTYYAAKALPQQRSWQVQIITAGQLMLYTVACDTLTTHTCFKAWRCTLRNALCINTLL